MSNIQNSSFADFVLDVNVNIEVRDNFGDICKTVNKHNRATAKMLRGMINFLRGDFNTSNRNTDYKTIRDIDKAKNYIPCYVGMGTAGIELDAEGLPNYNPSNKRLPPVTMEWRGEKVQFKDTQLKKEIDTVSRYEIGVLDEALEKEEGIEVDVVDSDHFVLATDISPNYYTANAYNKTTDIFITEIGLFSTPTPNDGNLLARVALTNDEDILYVRPQDTILVRWIICLISLTDLSESHSYDEHGEDIYTPVDMTGPTMNVTNETEEGE